MFDERKPTYADERAELKSLLSESDYESAKDGVMNAHYTHPDYVQAIWDSLADYGLTSGNVLEPGCGAGTFISRAPQDVSVTGVEVDTISAKVAQALNPDDIIRHEGYQHTPTPFLYDGAVGNVPFSEVRLFDRANNPGHHATHNHFIIKALNQTKPGGVVAVLTSRFTMDSINPAARRDMYERADLLSATRLPTSAHKQTANTEVVTDLLVFRVRGETEKPQPFDWEHSTPVEIGDSSVPINSYFQNNPANVLGTFDVSSGMYSSETLQVVPNGVDQSLVSYTADGIRSTLSKDLSKATEQGLGFSPHEPSNRILPVARASKAKGMGSLRQTQLGDFEILTENGWTNFKVPKTQRKELAHLLLLRDDVRTLVETEAANRTDTPELASYRAKLRNDYQSYVSTYGALNRVKKTARVKPDGEEVISMRYDPVMYKFRRDPFAGLTFAIENYDVDSEVAKPAPIQTSRQIYARYQPKGADNAIDALYISKEQKGTIDFDYIQYLTGYTDKQEVLKALEGEIFELPEGGWVTRAEYLSGDVVGKLEQAQARAYAGEVRFEANVKALEAVQPKPLTPVDITVRIGAPWISPYIHSQFINELLNAKGSIKVSNSPDGGWLVSGGPTRSIESTVTWGTNRMYANEIYKNLLNQNRITVNDTIDGKSKINVSATEAAKGKAEQMEQAFKDWIWADPDRARSLVNTYNHRFNRYVTRSYEAEGKALQLPGLAANLTLRPHQKTAVARMVAEPTTGLFHDVGAGKTLAMAAGVMEQRRLGLIQKPMVIVPNHMLGQFEREWLQAFPQAKLLTADTKTISTKNGRAEFFAKVATSSWDAIICTQSAFGKLPMSDKAQTLYIEREIQELRTFLSQLDDDSKKSVSRTQKALQDKREELRKKRYEVSKGQDDGLTFEQLGVDYLVVDEAHLYKNLKVNSKIQGLSNPQSADRAADLDLKLQWLRQAHGPRCATLATATPIANSMAEMWVMTRYLRPDLLEMSGTATFDNWAKTFIEVSDRIEVGPTGELRNKFRPRQFVNLPELMQIWTTFADVKLRADLDLQVPQLALDQDGNRKPRTILINLGVPMEQFRKRLEQRADAIKDNLVDPTEDNSLSVANDGKAVANDYRIINPDRRDFVFAGVDLPMGPQKIDVAAEQIATVYHQNKNNKYKDDSNEVSDTLGALQIVFLDQGTPKDGEWNLYDELKNKLSDLGVPPEKICFAHDAKTSADKDRLFARARTGAIAVLIGSTAKMGTGANMQTRAIALHHIDAPWRPADFDQRNGRIIRQKNQNPEIQIYRYVTVNSFDAYMWQTLERKAAFIHQILSGQYNGREVEDISQDELDYAEIKAIATGNPLLVEEARLKDQVRTLKTRENAQRRSTALLKADVEQWKRSKLGLENEQTHYAKLAEHITDTSADKFEASLNGQTYTKRAEFQTALLDLLGKTLPETEFPEARHTPFGQEPQRGPLTLFSMKLGGLEWAVLGPTQSSDKREDTPVVSLTPKNPAGRFSHPLRNPQFVVGVTKAQLQLKPKRFAQSLEHKLTLIREYPDRIQEKIDNLNNQIENGLEEINKPNPWTTPRNQAENELLEIRQRIMEFDNEKQAQSLEQTSPALESSTATHEGTFKELPAPTTANDEDNTSRIKEICQLSKPTCFEPKNSPQNEDIKPIYREVNNTQRIAR